MERLVNMVCKQVMGKENKLTNSISSITASASLLLVQAPKNLCEGDNDFDGKYPLVTHEPNMLKNKSRGNLVGKIKVSLSEGKWQNSC